MPTPLPRWVEEQAQRGIEARQSREGAAGELMRDRAYLEQLEAQRPTRQMPDEWDERQVRWNAQVMFPNMSDVQRESYVQAVLQARMARNAARDALWDRGATVGNRMLPVEPMDMGGVPVGPMPMVNGRPVNPMYPPFSR